MENVKKIGDFVISLDRPLGKGSFGSVFFGYKQDDPSFKIAAKVMSNSNIQSSPHRDKIIESIKREIAVLKKIKNPNVVQLYTEYLTSNNIYLMFEYCKDGDLLNYRESRGGSSSYLPEGEAIEFFRHICNGFKSLYQAKIIHRDIKPSNILLHEGNAKIADFGFARFTDDVDQKTYMTEVGSPLYMAPEIFNQNKYNSKCDVWSLGILLFELLYGTTPWNANSAYDLFNKISKNPLKFPAFPKRSSKIKDLLQGMIQTNPDTRLSWETIFKHEFVSENIYTMKELKNSDKIDENLAQSMISSTNSLSKKLVQGNLNHVTEKDYKIEEEKNEKDPVHCEKIKNAGETSPMKKPKDFKIKPESNETKNLIKKIKDQMLYERNIAFFLKGTCHLLVAAFGAGLIHIEDIFLYRIVFVLQKYEMVLMKYSLDLTEGKIPLEKIPTAEFFVSNEYPNFVKQMREDYDECDTIYQQVLKLLLSKKDALKKNNLIKFIGILQTGLICDQKFGIIYKETIQEFMDAVSLEFFSIVEQNKPEDIEIDYLKLMHYLQIASSIEKPFNFFKKKEGEQTCQLFFQFYDEMSQIEAKDLISSIKKNWSK